jgi:hypothetical protein
MASAFLATQDTYEPTIGMRESLSELIYNITPTETPFLMMAGRGTASRELEEWQLDSLDAAAHSPTFESFAPAAADAETLEPTIRMLSPTQINQKTISVSGTVEIVNKAGRSSELSYQLAKRAKEIKRDIETSIVGGNHASVRAGSVSVARVSPSLPSTFHENIFQSGPGDDNGNINIPAGATIGGWDDVTGLFDLYTVDSTKRPLLESMLQGVISGVWLNGGDPSTVMVGAFNKTTISSFTGNSTRFDRGEDKRLVSAVDVYVSDFGEHRIIPNRFQVANHAYVLTPELHEVAYLRPFRQHALAKIGDSEDRTLLAEWTYKPLNNYGNGFIADLTVA